MTEVQRSAYIMALKELFKEYELLAKYNGGTDYYRYCALDMAIKALEKPKTVIYSGDGYADGNMVYDMAECPNCGYEYEYGDKDWEENFCPHCGQPLNWKKKKIDED